MDRSPMDSSFFSQKMATWRPNFPHLSLAKTILKFHLKFYESNYKFARDFLNFFTQQPILNLRILNIHDFEQVLQVLYVYFYRFFIGNNQIDKEYRAN